MKLLIMDTIKPLNRDGSAIHRWELARNLSKLGCEVHVISYTEIKTRGVHIHPLTKKSKIKYITHVIKLVKKHRFDIIYARNTMIGVVGFLINNVWKSKLVFEVNGISLDELRLIENQSSTENKRFKYVKIKLLGYLEIFITKRADAVIVVTQGIKDYLINNGVDKNKVWVIENGANIELFIPIKNSNVVDELRNRLRINDDENVVVFIGNLAPWQGVEYLIHAAPLIIEKMQKTKFLIVGEGMIKQNLMALCRALNVESNFIFTGMVRYEDVPKYINISDVGIVPFIKDRVCSPIKLFEYLSSGKPVVSSNIENIREILNKSKAGILVTPEDPTELSYAIIKLLKDKQLREQMGNSGREFVVNNYSWEITAKKTKEVFESILD